MSDKIQFMMGRAQTFAERYCSESRYVTRLPVTWLTYFLAYRAGVRIDEIAAHVEVDRVRISRRLATVLAARADLTLCAEINMLAAEMGAARYEAGGEVLRFPGPSALVHRTVVSEGAA